MMLNRMRFPALCLAVAMCFSGCYTTKFYTPNPRDMDGVFFGSSEGNTVALRKEYGWRNWYLFGLIPSGDSEDGVARYIADATSDDQVIQRLEIRTQKSFLNGLGEIGIGLIPILGFFRPFLFNFREATVQSR